MIPRLMICISLALTVAIPLPAQPPPDEIALIRAIESMIASSSEKAVEDFVSEHYDPGAVTADTIARLEAIRKDARAHLGDIGVEKTPSGIAIILGETGAVRLDVTLTDSSPLKVRAITMEQKDATSSSGSFDDALRSHVRALELLHENETDEALRKLEANNLSSSYLEKTTPAERRQLVEQIRAASAQAGGVGITAEGGVYNLELSGRSSYTVTFEMEPDAPWKIRSLAIREQSSAELLEWDSLEDRLDRAESEGLSGVFHAVRDGKAFLSATFGYADREARRRHRPDTVFGIGSTPIDFTVAGILLLAQRGELSLEDPVTRFFDDVPNDKAPMTIRHLMTGRSGLPDFHEVPGVDWDFDLAWIDRDTAIERIMGQQLLFAPGQGRQHSHSAFGVLAAIIELVAGESYQDFVRRELFEPAGMTRTGFYGETLGLELDDFAIGYGASSVGLPNIPPNWGPTSWLVMGSGGMYSTLPDMLSYYETITSGEILEGEYLDMVSGATADVGGSQRGFYFFHAFSGKDDRILLMTNNEGRAPGMRDLTRELMNFMLRNEED